MVSSTLSDSFLLFAFWTGIAAVALTVLLGLQIIGLRMAHRRSQRRERQVIDKWRPVLGAALTDAPPDTLPPLHRHEQLLFLKLWLHLHASVRGHAHAALNDIGMRLQCDAFARNLLARGNRAQRLLALLALGHLRDRQAWDALMREAASTDSVVSLKALWALLQIDAPAALEIMMPVLLRREDWPLVQLAAIFKVAPVSCAPALAAVLPALDEHALPRALRLAHAIRAAVPDSLLVRLFGHGSVEVVLAAMRLAASPAMLPQLRARVADADWRIRVQVARSLGRIGGPEDAELLRQMLHDEQWWVRYRAAQALVMLPSNDPAALHALHAGLADRYARDMLDQVMAEKGIA